MRRPPDDICKRIHDLWARASDPSNEHESAFARTKLRELQIELGLSNFMLTYIIEREQKAPSKLEPSQIEFDPIEIMLDLFELARIKLTPEQEIVTAVWVGHSYVFHHYRHTPRLLLRSREGGCGKTALMSLIQVTAANALKLDDVSAAVIYNYLSDNPGTTFLIDNGERNPALWSGEQLLLNIYEHGHRERGRVSRLINRQPVFYPCFAPLALAYIERDVQLSSEALERSTIIDMVKNREGRDEFDYGHPLIPAFRVGAHGFAETFKRPKNVSLPKELDCRFLDNWRVLIEIGTVLGYPRTIGAA